MSRSKKSPLAISNTGERFVKVSALMNSLVAHIDCLPVVTFGKEKALYLRLPDAINWLEKEIAQCSGAEREKYSALRTGLIRVRDEPEHKLVISD